MMRMGLSDDHTTMPSIATFEADLRMFMQSCRRAIEMLNSAFAEGQFGASARDARVIYGQTDSLFVAFPSSTVSTSLNAQPLAPVLRSLTRHSTSAWRPHTRHMVVMAVRC